MITIQKVWFNNDKIFVELSDQRIVGTPIKWYKNLQKGTLEQREHFEIRGDYVHWPELDEDLGAEGFLTFEPKS